MSTIEKIIPVSTVLGKTPKNKKESLSISMAAKIKKKKIHLAITTKNKIVVYTIQRSNKRKIDKTNDGRI